jgi:hypothetical protein
MKAAWPWLTAAVLVLPAAMLVLNLMEKDYYDYGSLEPVDEEKAAREDLYLRQKLVPETWEHPCANGTACAHPIEIVETRRRLTVDDEDGWYRLFWAGTEVYHFEELVHVTAAMQNLTARNPRGRWTIRARLGRPAKPCPPGHECGDVARPIELDYELIVSTEPIADVAVELDGGRLLRVAHAMTAPGASPRLPPVRYYGWRTELKQIPVEPCPCR